MFTKSIELTILITLYLFQFSGSARLSPCGDWKPYKSDKCIKVLSNLGNEREAERNCSSLDSTMITFRTKEEQNFVMDLLSNYSNLSTGAWIGLKLNTSSETYEWTDGTVKSFENWNDGTPDPKSSSPCVQISLAKLNLGKWSDETCAHKALITCQKKQEWNLALLHDAMEELANNIESKMEQVQGSLPIGFIYIQLPYQAEPKELWSKYEWKEISSNYSGLFFRTVGGKSAPFGTIQESNQTIIKEIDFETMRLQNSYGYRGENKHINLDEGRNNQDTTKPDTTSGRSTTPEVITGYPELLYQMHVFVSDGEIRPRNLAIKLWKRTA